MCHIQIAHLGYPADQPGSLIDYTLVDQRIMDLDGKQAQEAEERLMYVRKYQPNAAFRFTLLTSNRLWMVRKTTRVHWNLPQDAFVHALFCSLGRLDTVGAKCRVSILLRTPKLKMSPNSVLLLQDTALFAVPRLLWFFRQLGIPRNCIASESLHCRGCTRRRTRGTSPSC